MAPNLPIYEKLIRDFGDPSYEKYVFKGISEFVNNQPVIVNGSNYEQFSGRTLFSDQEIHINIFNISKFNSDNKATTKNGQRLAPKMKRLSEYIGQSYFEYLSKLDDLVILMDEAHRYHCLALEFQKEVFFQDKIILRKDEIYDEFIEFSFEFNK